MELLAVGIGGAIGASLRYFLSQIIVYETGFPLATCIANLIGCFLLSYLLSGKLLKSYPKMKLALTTGLLGSFTTFSTFSNETISLISDQLYGIAFVYVLLSAIGGLLLSFVGYRLGSRGDVI